MTTQTYEYRSWKPVSPAQRLGALLATVLCVACLALAALMLLPGLFGYQRYVITSGSMTGSYDRGSVVVDDVVPIADLAVGDVITYTPPAGSGPDGTITHRIFSIEADQLGRPVFRTKGDANDSVDPWTFTLDQPTQARVAFHVPYVGYIFAALSIRTVRVLVIGLPALLIGAAAVSRLRREARAAAASERARA